MHERQRTFEAHRGKDGAKRLAGLVRVDGHRLAGEVFLAILPGLRTILATLDFFIQRTVLKLLLLLLQHLFVLGTPEQVKMIKHAVGILRHDETFFKHRIWIEGTGSSRRKTG
jgi:hypothetical protein